MQQITVSEFVWDQEGGGLWTSEIGSVFRERTGKWWFYPYGVSNDLRKGPYKSMKEAMKKAAK